MPRGICWLPTWVKQSPLKSSGSIASTRNCVVGMEVEIHGRPTAVWPLSPCHSRKPRVARSRKSDGPLAPQRFVCWIQISHLMKSLKNIGTTGGDSVVIRTAGKRNFAVRAPDPGAAFSEAPSDFEFKCGSELSMGRELPYFFKFALSVSIVGQGNVDRRFSEDFLEPQ
jgi:hypothetical protein